MDIRACLGAVVGFSARARGGRGATTTTRKKELEVEREGGRNMTWVAAAFLAAPLCIRGSSECECEGCKNGVGNGGRKEESDWHDLSDRNICMGRARKSSERFNGVCLQHKLH